MLGKPITSVARMTLPDGGYRIADGGERGLSYFDKAGHFVIDYRLRGSRDKLGYEFEISDIYSISDTSDVVKKFGPVQIEKALEIEVRIRHWLDTKGLG